MLARRPNHVLTRIAALALVAAATLRCGGGSGDDTTGSEGGSSGSTTSTAPTSGTGDPPDGTSTSSSSGGSTDTGDSTTPTSTSSSSGSTDTGTDTTGGSTTTTTGTTTSTTDDTTGELCTPGQGTVLAVTAYQLGDGNNGQWKQLGFDLDGLTSTAASTDVCALNSDASPGTAYPDGDGGIDNSFGKNVLPQLLALQPSLVSDKAAAIQSGRLDELFDLRCLPESGDAPAFVTALVHGVDLGAPPAFDGTDFWPVEPGLLGDPADPDSSTFLFPASSVTGDAFDAGAGGTFVLMLPVQTSAGATWLRLTLHAARVTMTLAADRKSATGGRIGGVLVTEELVAEIKKLGAALDLCGTAFIDSLVMQVRQASDILSDGAQDPDTTCDGISIGLGFTAQAAQLGAVGPPLPLASACP